MSEIYSFTQQELEKAYDLWFADYEADKESFIDYDDKDFDSANYGKYSADMIIKYLNKITEAQ
ncbi:hypothetical protein vB_PsyM_KIL3b_0111 [Pseudomonas phage vB_PsyM_KIL3b]|uniref:Uncharacterized protein n=3 Tax=Pseudomonas phage vB_PsyM_KIL1 TaxID=1777065 RepID=A0A142IG21_9CAUD|nr:hypothetical protein BH774_gp092 [Pseudomonas phage vB_PsyM_KIL1]AMR57357.1 hypothetical protein vB_PsyM_KIL1_0110 [Pseudomonas phage vB_PsyM_KIL1]AMR57678.1 hypothetical protein vB_PsyM_KIL3_0111 [Pseudomonas phage vB_PsyM_KIL3]AMR58176.1 hypothetical protein vB_PsyM_KIL3b_0111 [Pseudomonas phage vB_PsyM_KIL3b]